MKSGEKYCPSNGSEGCAFTSRFCDRCAHEKFSHTGNSGDKCCEILSATMAFDIRDPQYPSEWTYDLQGSPTCTKFKLHEWKQDDMFNWNDPEEEINDPNQLKLPFDYDPRTGDIKMTEQK